MVPVVDVQFPVAPMVAQPAAGLPSRGRHSYEPKLDGWRCLAFRNARVQLQSRQQRSLTARFPSVADAVAAQLPVGTVIDGELVAMRGGRVDFTALGSSEAGHWLVVFDLLAHGGRDIRGEPLHSRRDRLADLVGDAEDGVVLAPAVDDVALAQAWLDRSNALGLEGIVAKRLDQAYRPHRLRWSKVRATQTREAVVGGVIGSIEQPQSLILGQFDHRGSLRIIGRTRRLSRLTAAEVGARLALPRGIHPWPAVIPGARLGLPGATDDVAHTPVEPGLVVEIEVDTAIDRGRARHGVRYRRIRPDLLPEDLAATP